MGRLVWLFHSWEGVQVSYCHWPSQTGLLQLVCALEWPISESELDPCLAGLSGAWEPAFLTSPATVMWFMLWPCTCTVLFCFGTTSGQCSSSFWFWVQMSHLAGLGAGLGGPHGMQGIESGSTTCKVNHPYCCATDMALSLFFYFVLIKIYFFIHAHQCSGLISDSKHRDLFWWCSGDHLLCWEFSPCLPFAEKYLIQCSASPAPSTEFFFLFYDFS